MSSPELEKQAKALNELAKFCDKQEQVKRVSKNELKDVAVISLAYSLLKDDTKGSFINKDIETKIDSIRYKMDKILDFYITNNKTNHSRVINILDALDHKIRANKTELTTTATQCALNLLYFMLAPNERNGIPLSNSLKMFWDDIKDDVFEVLNAAADKSERYENFAVDSDILAQFVKDNI